MGFQQKADERILGDGDFVAKVLAEAKEQLERKYRLNKIISGKYFFSNSPTKQKSPCLLYLTS